MGQILGLVVKLKWVFVVLSGLLFFALIGALVDRSNSKKFKFAEDSVPNESDADVTETTGDADKQPTNPAPEGATNATPAPAAVNTETAQAPAAPAIANADTNASATVNTEQPNNTQTN